jgi:dienelactone hydrolase
MIRGLLVFCILGLFAITSCGKKPVGIVEKEVTYNSDGTVMKGYLAYNGDVEGKRPGILVVHEWWGLNSYARKRAHMLAELGYVAMAVDMYGDGKQANHPDDAGKFASEVMQNMGTAKARFTAASTLLARQEVCDPQRIAAIGYCFGGGVVLQMARLGLPLAGVASFHGSLATASPAQPGQVKARVLVCNGADDKFIPPGLIESFKKEMDSAGVDYRFINYPGALHGFTNPEATALGEKFNIPLAYNEAADKQSWTDLQEFLKRVFPQ